MNITLADLYYERAIVSVTINHESLETLERIALTTHKITHLEAALLQRIYTGQECRDYYEFLLNPID